RLVGDAVANHVDALVSSGWLVLAAVDLVGIGDAAKRELDRAALARTTERLGLLGLHLERGGLADERVGAFFFLRRLIDGEHPDIGQDDFRTDDVRRL